MCSTLDGSELEGEVIGGDYCDELSGEVDLAETFTVRTDQGSVFSVHGWLVDVVILEKDRTGHVIRKPKQHAMHCRCGRAKILAHGMCAVCYTLKRQDEEYFGGLRERVLERDGYRCRVCDASGRDKRSIIVHHRVPGKSVLNLMISLCPGCHAKIHRTRVVVRLMPPLLLELWRELHPKAHEQTALNFSPVPPSVQVLALFSAE